MEENIIVYEILDSGSIIGTFQFNESDTKHTYFKYPLRVSLANTIGSFYPMNVRSIGKLMEEIASNSHRAHNYAAFNCTSDTNELKYVLSLRNGQLELVDQFGKVCVQRKFTHIQIVDPPETDGEDE